MPTINGVKNTREIKQSQKHATGDLEPGRPRHNDREYFTYPEHARGHTNFYTPRPEPPPPPLPSPPLPSLRHERYATSTCTLRRRREKRKRSRNRRVDSLRFREDFGGCASLLGRWPGLGDRAHKVQRQLPVPAAVQPFECLAKAGRPTHWIEVEKTKDRIATTGGRGGSGSGSNTRVLTRSKTTSKKARQVPTVVHSLVAKLPPLYRSS